MEGVDTRQEGWRGGRWRDGGMDERDIEGKTEGREGVSREVRERGREEKP